MVFVVNFCSYPTGKTAPGGTRPPKPTRMVPVTVEMIGPELKLPVVMPHNLVAW
jgi:hypothetical protein